MVAIPSLWLPILISAALVFLVSSVIHMFLTYHSSDFRSLPDEDRAMEALRALNIPPGDYMMPFCSNAEEMRSDAYRKKVEAGPVGVVTLFPNENPFGMGRQLTQWFLYAVLVAVVVAYVAGRTLAPGADYLAVFRLTGTVAFACYAMALPQRSIWYKQNWPATLKSMFDGLVYACLTAGAFGWLWPN